MGLIPPRSRAETFANFSPQLISPPQAPRGNEVTSSQTKKRGKEPLDTAAWPCAPPNQLSIPPQRCCIPNIATDHRPGTPGSWGDCPVPPVLCEAVRRADASGAVQCVPAAAPRPGHAIAQWWSAAFLELLELQGFLIK